MGATYTRQSTFTDGDVITADLFNNEFDQLLAAFAVNTGHTHDGTAGEGGPISLVASDNVTIGTGAGDITLTWDGGSNDGALIWSEDEDYFTFSDDILMATSEKLQFRDTAIYINSSADGQLDLVADTEIQIAATTVDIDGLVDISGNLTVGGDLVVTGTTTFNGGTITLGDAATDNVVFAADVDSSIIPDDDDTYDLGSATQEWRNLFIDGTANIDTASIDNISDDTLVATNKKIQFRDTAISVSSSADATLDIASDGAINLTAGTDVVIPANVGITFGTGEKIEGDSTDLTITSGADINLTATADVNVPSGVGITFGDDGEKIEGDGTDLAINSSGDVNITATTVDLNGNLEVSGTLTQTGIATFTDDIIIGDGKTIGSTSDIDAITIAANGQVTLTQTLIGTALDISGDIDVDGVTNLDVVDIDGAVDMASTLDVAGAVTISSADNSTQLTLVSTDADASVGPVLKLFRNSSSPAANDVLGKIDFSGENSEGTEKSFFRIKAQAVDVTAGSEDTNIYFSSIVAGSEAVKMTFSSAKVEIDDALDVTGNLDVDGVTNLDVVDIDGAVNMATTLLVTGVVTANAGVVVDEMTLDADTLTATDDFILDAAGNIEINADGGTVTFKDADAVLGTVTSAGFSGTSAGIVVTDNNANTNFPVVFHDESNGLLDDTGALRYNPSTGELLVPKLTVAGTTTTVDTVTMEAANAIIFEGATADAHETTLTIVDPTADRTINMPNQSGTLAVLAAASNTAITSTPEELNILDGATVVVGEVNALDLGSTGTGTAIASKAVILDGSKDYTGIRNLTITGELDAATLDISGAIDVAGTANLDVVDIDGAVDMASTLQVDGVATFTGVPIASAGLSVKNGATGAGFIQFFEDSDNGDNKVTLIGPASTADVTLTLPAAAGTIATTDDATALAIALG